jgi:tetratricopeptide (TPR) repeat protein
MAFDKRKALQNALTFAQQGRWDKAIAEYQAILKADPNDLTVCNNLGDLYARTGKVAEAIEQYLKLGELYRADGLSVKAIAVYKKIVKLDPARTEAHLACADLYEEQGLTGEAKIQLATVAEHYARAGDTPKVVEVYQRLAQLNPSNHVLLAKLADLLLKQGMQEAAAAEYERAATAAQAAGQAAESKRLYKKVRDLTPESPQADLALAEQQLHEGKYAEAVGELSKATAGDPKNGLAWRLLGEAYLGQEQVIEAVTALERAMAAGVPEAEVRRPLAVALVRAGRTDEGIRLCHTLTEDALGRGDPDGAIAVCRHLLAVAPHLTPVHAHLVGLLQELRRDEEARSAAWGLAEAHEANGETEAAIHVYHQLLEQDPSDAEARTRLEVLEGAPAPAAEIEELAIPALEVAAPPVEQEEPSGPVLEVVPPAQEDLGLVLQETPPQDPGLVLQETSPEEPAALELPAEDALTLGEPTGVQSGGEFNLEARPSQVYELDESGELAGIRYSRQEPHGGSLDRLTGPAAPGLEFASESLGETQSSLQPVREEAEEEELPEEAVEQLAEAEVYLKYGLTEKARERLLEVVRLAPDNLGARRRLKSVYLERPQVEEACGEVLAIARILAARGRHEAAQREIQEGLSLVPGHAELQAFLVNISPKDVRPAATAPGVTTVAAPPPTQAPAYEIQEPIEIPGAVVPREGLVPSSELGPATSREAVADQTVPREVRPPELVGPGPGPRETGPPGVGASEMVPSDAVPTFELPEAEGLEAGWLEFSPGATRVTEAASVEEELTPEFQALLEEPEEEPALVVEGGEVNLEQAMADDLAEAEFYLSQGMVEEACAVHRRMQARDSRHPAVARLGNEVAPVSVVAAPEPAETQRIEPPPSGEIPAAEAPVPPGLETTVPPTLGAVPGLTPGGLPEVVPPLEPLATTSEALPAGASATPSTAEPALATGPAGTGLSPGTQEEASHEAGAEGYVNLGAELEEELAAEDRASSAVMSGPLVDDLLKEFQKGVRDQLDEKDFETHYNLGIAYKEMDLFDEAIQEFQLAARDPARALACANLLGLCYLAKSEPDAAIRELRAGLEVRGHPQEAYHGLRYDLGMAYEIQGDLGRALESFEGLQAEEPRFRDVRARIKQLRDRLKQQPAPASPVPVPVQVAEPPKRGKDRKKISFI